MKLGELVNLQSVRFLIVGILNTLVGLGAYYLTLTWLQFHFVVALTVSHIIGVIHSYLWNNYWTFNGGNTNMTKVTKFSLVYLITYVVNLFILSMFIKTFGFTPLLGQVISIFITTILSFLGHKYWSFKKK